MKIFEKTLLASRYILAVFYAGLMIGLFLYACRFALKLWQFATEIFTSAENDALLGLLYLLDSALVAGVVVMVVLSSYDTLVGPLHPDAKQEGVDWIGTIDPGNLKIKLATAIVAISSIHLLQIFLKVESYEDRAVMWALAIHVAFLAGVIVLALMDRLEGFHKEEGEKADPAEKM